MKNRKLGSSLLSKRGQGPCRFSRLMIKNHQPYRLLSPSARWIRIHCFFHSSSFNTSWSKKVDVMAIHEFSKLSIKKASYTNQSINLDLKFTALHSHKVMLSNKRKMETSYRKRLCSSNRKQFSKEKKRASVTNTLIINRTDNRQTS